MDPDTGILGRTAALSDPRNSADKILPEVHQGLEFFSPLRRDRHTA